MNKPLSTHDSIPLRDCGLLNDECRSKGFCQGHSEPLSTQSPSDRYYGEVLRQIGDITPYIDLTTRLDELSKAGRINDMRRELAVFVYDQSSSMKAQLDREAEARGMQRAKSRVLRRTEIPADAKNPTRDIVVVIGEECARIIQQDIDDLTSLNKGEQ